MEDTAETRSSWRVRITVVLVVLLLIAAFFAFDLGAYLDLGFLKSVHADAVRYVHAQPVESSVGYFVLYVAVTALSLPGAAVMTLAAGAVFGLWWGLVLVSFASSLGATLAMVIARLVLGNWVQERFSRQLEAVNEGLEKDGAFYLFSLRMVPVFPFFVINLVMGLTRIPVWQFYWVSQVGMLAGTLVYVFAGTQLAEVSRVGDVLSLDLIVALSLLGLFPLLARKLLAWLKRARNRNV